MFLEVFGELVQNYVVLAFPIHLCDNVLGLVQEDLGLIHRVLLE